MERGGKGLIDNKKSRMDKRGEIVVWYLLFSRRCAILLTDTDFCHVDKINVAFCDRREK